MNRDFEQLQRDYIEALRPVVAAALRWWNTHCPYPHTELRPFDEMAPFHRRWIAGPAAHPRVLAVFRQYWFQVQDLNDHFASAPAALHVDVDTPDKNLSAPARPRELPIDLLVNDLSTIAPDLFEVMQGIVYVPIGTNPLYDEEY